MTTTIIKSKQAYALKEKANLELWNKNYTNALNLLTEALELDPDNIEYHLSKAAVYNLSGLFSNAIKECKITLEKGNKKRKERGDSPSSSSDNEKIKNEIQEIDQLISKAYARMGSAYLGANQLKESRTCIENAIIIQQCEEFDEMLNMIDDLIDFATTEAKNLFRLANDAYYAKKYQEAIDLYTEAIEIDTQNNILFSNRSMCFNKLKRYQEALNDAQKAIDIENRDSHHSYLPRYAKGNALYFLGRYQEALESYQDSLKNKPDSPVLLKKIKKTLLKIELSSTNKKKSSSNGNNEASSTNNNNNNNTKESTKSKNENEESSSSNNNNNNNNKKNKKQKGKKQKQQPVQQQSVEDQTISPPAPSAVAVVNTKETSTIESSPKESTTNAIDQSTNSLESNLETSTQLQEDYGITMIPNSTSPSKPSFIKTKNLESNNNKNDKDEEEDDPFKINNEKEYEEKIKQQQEEEEEQDNEDEDVEKKQGKKSIAPPLM